jgi:hypothetical protein
VASDAERCAGACQPASYWRLSRRVAAQALLGAVLVATIGCDRVTKRFAVETLAGTPDRSFLAGTSAWPTRKTPAGS